MLQIGMTGGIGTGKTTVAGLFREIGAPVIDADELAHQLVRPGAESLNDIIRTFGPDILNRQGELNRARLREIVFSDPQKRHLLEDILHPRILDEMHEKVSRLSTPYCILSIPLLIETNNTSLVDRILVVDMPEDLQRRRAMKRDNLSARAFEAIALAQTNRQERLAVADDIITNDGSHEALQQQVMALHQKYLALTS